MTCYNSELPIGPPGPTGPQGPPGEPGTTLPYKIYTASISQSESGDPSINELFNNTDSPGTIIRAVTGTFLLSGEWNNYTADKLFYICSSSEGYASLGNNPISDNLELRTYPDSATLGDFFPYKVYIEIRIYP